MKRALIDRAGAYRLDLKLYNALIHQGIYLVHDDPRIRVLTLGGFIQDALGRSAPLEAEVEGCRGERPENSSLKGQTAYLVRINVQDALLLEEGQLLSEFLEELSHRPIEDFNDSGPESEE